MRLDLSGTPNDLFEQMSAITKAHAYDIIKESADYWEKRCRAAEQCYDLLNLTTPHKKEYDEWNKLKKEEFTRFKT